MSKSLRGLVLVALSIIVLTLTTQETQAIDSYVSLLQVFKGAILSVVGIGALFSLATGLQWSFTVAE